jgi:hypothetical protein
MTELVSTGQESEASLASRRRPRLVSSWAALKQIRAALANPELKIRQRDKLSDSMLMLAIIYAFAIFLFPVHAHPMIGIADVVFGLAFLSYATQRLGIITTLNDRQTVLVAQLMFCMLLIGMYITLNIGAIYVWLKLVGPGS